METSEPYKPSLRLSGTDGNAFSIIARAMRALEYAEKEGLLPEGTHHKYREEATAEDYDNVLAVTMEYCEVD
jgi:hypothetical protein